MNGEMACSKVKESAMFPLFKHEIETRKFDSNKLQNSFQVQDHLIGMYFTLLDIFVQSYRCMMIKIDTIIVC